MHEERLHEQLRYKIGRTDDWLVRIKNYPKGSELVYFQQWRPAGDSLVDAETISSRSCKGFGWGRKPPSQTSSSATTSAPSTSKSTPPSSSPSCMTASRSFNSSKSWEPRWECRHQLSSNPAPWLLTPTSQSSGTSVTSEALYERFIKHVCMSGYALMQRLWVGA